MPFGERLMRPSLGAVSTKNTFCSAMNCFSSGVMPLYQFDIGCGAPAQAITREITSTRIAIKARSQSCSLLSHASGTSITVRSRISQIDTDNLRNSAMGRDAGELNNDLSIHSKLLRHYQKESENKGDFTGPEAQGLEVGASTMSVCQVWHRPRSIVPARASSNEVPKGVDGHAYFEGGGGEFSPELGVQPRRPGMVGEF